MTGPNDTHPEWLRALLREARVRRGLILDGNVKDIFYDAVSREYVTLSELLVRLFVRDRSLGFTVVGLWDAADGLRFPNERHARRFDEALSRQLGGSSTRPAGDAYDVGDDSESSETCVAQRYPNPGELLPAFRQLLSVDSESPVLVMDWTHMLVTHPGHPDAIERQWMLNLIKAIVGNSVVPMDSDHLRQGGRGLLVLLAANLRLLPQAIYLGDSRVRVLTVPTPSRLDRRAFFLRHADDARCQRPRSSSGTNASESRGSDREALADIFADLTEQLTITDLRQILTLSLHIDEPLPPEGLLNLYRFGEQRSPWEDLNEDKLREVEEILRGRVIGQDEAVKHVATMIIRAYMGLAGLHHSARRDKPKGTLFFVGPTGVGKTELAKACAEFLFGDESACLRFDMSEYNHEHSDQRLVGAPPGYVGFEEGGQLTNAVRHMPFSVLLFDEIEKAHPRVLDKFLQILEDGRLTDGRGETTYFSECVLIFTSNIGAADMPAKISIDEHRRHFLRAVEDHFIKELKRPELLNRFGDNIVVFDLMADNEVRRGIYKRKLAPLRQYLEDRFGLSLRMTDGLEEHYLTTARSEYGGRGILNALERDLLNPLARFLFERKHQLRRGRVVSASLEEGKVTFDLEDV